MKTIQLTDLENLCYGASILGSGGGGHPKILKDYVHHLFSQNKEIEMMTVHDLNSNHLVVPIAFVGAPLISLERLPNALSFHQIYQKIQKDYPRHQVVLMPAEIGGCNALTPFVLALLHQLPILDADLIGRAFPQINMCKPAVLNSANPKTYLSCHRGNLITLDLQTPELIESLIRSSVVHFGASATIATFLFQGDLHEQYAIPGSLSRCLSIAKEKTFGKKIAEGLIQNVYHQMQNGFLIGEVHIQNVSCNLKIHFQNEFLYIEEAKGISMGSPDIIVLIEKKTKKPLSTESLRFGLEVEVYLLDAPDFWKQPKHQIHVDFKKFL